MGLDWQCCLAVSFKMATKILIFFNGCQTFYISYSHLFNKRGAWNKRGGGAKVAKSLNVELGINEEGGIFGKI